jgi:hypothetical protein
MGYWKQMYGERNKEFIKGVIAAMETYAIWHDGKQYIGVKEQLLKEAIQEAKEELGWKD